jgi:Fuc2NAc and GlcNAc transferase
MVEALLAAAVALPVSAALTGLVRHFALARGLLDVPNARSSHSAATPRLGGIAVVLVVSAAVLALAASGDLPAVLCWTLIGGGLAVAAVGLRDDFRSVSPALRLAVHLGAAVWAMLLIGPPTQLQSGTLLIHLGWTGAAIAVLGSVWLLNLFNFMDGIDGIAAGEAAFITLSGSVLTLVTGGPHGVASVGLLLGAACLGFLVWNWPPARIFLGDVGSGYLGYSIAVLALASSRANPAALWTWLILGALFFTDATVTLIRRTLRGDRIYQAHRTHAYQLLAQRWGSHGRVTLTVTAINVIWLLPGAVLAARYPARASWIALIAYAPIIAATVIAGAGSRKDLPTKMPTSPAR